MQRILSIIVLMFFTHSISAQIDWSDIILVKSLQSKTDKTKPAVFSFTIPENKQSSFLINAALGFDISTSFLDRDNKLMTLSPFVEYNKNTLIDKEQDQFQSGLSFEWLITKDNDKLISALLSDIKYVNNLEKDIESFQSSFFFAPKITGITSEIKNFYVPDNIVYIGSDMAFEYVPYIGIETESRFKTEEDSLKGNIYRLVAKIQSNLFLIRAKDLDGEPYFLLEFNLDYQYRNEFSNSTSSVLTNRNFLQLGFNYTLYKNSNIEAKVGLDYVYGVNPSKSFEEQEYYNFSLKLKL